MKNILLGMTIALSLSLTENSALARVDFGSEGVGGGNIYAAEFSEVARESIVKIFTFKPVFIEGFEIDAERMRDTFSKVKIFAVDQNLTIDGKPVYAINDPQKLHIYFNQVAWAQLRQDQKKQLVLHELIGLTFPEISDLNYFYSSSLLYMLSLNNKDSFKVHCGLNARNQTGYIVLDRSLTWIHNEVSVSANLADFNLNFFMKDSYVQISLIDKSGKTLFDGRQYAGHGLNFETRINYQTNISGQAYDTLELFCEQPLSPAI